MISEPSAYTNGIQNSLPFFDHVRLVSPDGGTTLRYSSGRIYSADSTVQNAPRVLEVVAERRACDPSRSTFIPSTLLFDLVDVDEQVTSDLSGREESLSGWTVDFYRIFRTTDWDSSDYITRFSGFVSDVGNREGGRYRVTCRSAFGGNALNRQIHTSGRTTLSSAISDSVKTIVVANASSWQSAGYFAIDSERISYTGKIDNGNSTWSLTGCTRGVGGSTAASHSAAAAVREVFVFTGSDIGTAVHIFDAFATLLHSTEEKNGLAIDSSYRDTSDWSSKKAIVGTGYTNYAPQATIANNAKKFLEEEFFAIVGGFPFEDNMGRLKVGLFDLPSGSDFVGTIDDTYAVGIPEFKGTFDRRLNDVLVNYDADDVEGDGSFGGQSHEYLQGLIDLAGGRRFDRYLVCRGLRGDATTMLRERAYAGFGRLGTATPVLEFTTHMGAELFEVGDPIFCTFRNVVDPIAGAVGITSKPFQIISQELDHRKLQIRFRVLGFPSLGTVDDGSYFTDDQTPVHIAGGGRSTIG